MTTAAQPSRDERRRRSDADILAAAREQFAELGYERTTIRGVAASAGIDPALVMQRFGSKEGLFTASARWGAEHQSLLDATVETLPGAALADVFAKFEDAAGRDSAVALLRACLTHPTAAALMRDEVMCERSDAAARIIGGADAELRAGLIGACMIGLGMARYLLELPAVAGASREDVERLLEPALRALVGTPSAGDPLGS